MEKLELKTPRDYRGLGTDIDECLKIITERDYGFYEISEDDQKILTIVENMQFFQEYFNKGIKLLGWDGKQRKVEIYDYKKRQDEIDESLKGFRLG